MLDWTSWLSHHSFKVVIRGSNPLSSTNISSMLEVTYSLNSPYVDPDTHSPIYEYGLFTPLEFYKLLDESGWIVIIYLKYIR